MRLPAAILIAALAAPPASAQEVRMPILDSFAQWITSAWDGRSGRAADGSGEVRAASEASKPYGQKARKGVNSNDVDQFTSDRLWNPNGFTELRGVIRDGQDEGSTRVQVISAAGRVIFSERYPYIGRSANGDVVRWRFAPNQEGILQGAQIVYTMTEKGPKKNRNKNGITVRHSVTVPAEASCETQRRASFSGPSISDIRSASQSTQRGSRGENNRDEPGRNQDGEKRGRN